MAPNASQQLPRHLSHADSFLSASSLDSGASGLLTSVMKVRVGGLCTTPPSLQLQQQQQPQQQDVSATATLVAQALQDPALSESALLLLRSMRETANLERAPRSIMEQHDVDVAAATRQASLVTLGPIQTTAPKMDRAEKVKVLRRLYANRTRNKVSASDDDNDGNESAAREQQEKGQETGEAVGGISSTLEGELRKMIAATRTAKTVTPHSTPDINNTMGTAVQQQKVPIPERGSIIQVPTKTIAPVLPPTSHLSKSASTNKRKSSSLDDDGHRTKRIRFAAAASSSSSSGPSKKRTFASRCA